MNPRPLPFALLVLAACSSPGDYPSLARRPIESIPISDPVPTAAAPTASPIPLSSEVRAAVSAAEAADAAFRSDIAAANPTLAGARRATPGSEAWVVAQQAISRAEAARVPVGASLTTIDAARVAAGSAPSASLDAARDHVAALDRDEAEALAATNAELPGN